MLDVITSGKNTQWHTFPNLNTKCTYSHIDNEQVDFQVVPGHNCFLEINKKSGFELLRAHNKDGTDIFQRLKKRQLDDLYCGATSKTYGSQLALGMSTGFIRIFDVQTGDFRPNKIKPDRIGNRVTYLDYSNCDEYLAGLYESGDINLYGLKTGVKMDVFRLDGESTLIRFHPSKRFLLGVASYNGAITILDIQSKKKIFFEKKAHSQPCRDLSMISASPDTIVSCGYDCNLNVYDLRKRSMVQQSQQAHPLSTVCLSPCGTFCVAGNLKGDVISFDFRNLKEALNTKRCHDGGGGVIRVAFIPSSCESNTMLDKFGDTMNATNLATPLLPPAIKVREETSDSFIKFIDLCHSNNDVVRKASCDKRDSFFDLASPKRNHDFSTDSVLMSPSRLSIGSTADYSELRLKRLSRISMNNSVLSDIVPNNRRDSVLPDITCITEEEPVVDDSTTSLKRSKLRDSTGSRKLSLGSDLVEIHEETPAEKSDSKTSSQPDDSVASNKENRQNNHQDIEKFAKFIKDSHISTPNHVPIKPPMVNVQSTENVRRMISEIVDTKLNNFQNTMNAQLTTLSETISKRVNEAENEIKYYQDHYYHSGFGDSFRLFKLMEKEIDILKEGIALVIRDDSVAQEYYRLKAENEELKRRLENRN